MAKKQPSKPASESRPDETRSDSEAYVCETHGPHRLERTLAMLRPREGKPGMGYAEVLGDSDWRTDDNDLSSGPRASYGGIYARIGLTMGMPKRRDAMIPALVSVIPWLGR